MSEGGKKKASMSGKEKAALIMMMLGVDDAAEVTRHMNQLDVRELAAIAPKLVGLTENDLDEALGDFQGKLSSSGWVSTLDSEFSWDFIRGSAAEERFHSLDFLQRADKNQLLEIIKHEHPQVITFILSYIPADLAAGLLNQLPPKMQADIAYRISNMEAPNRLALKHLDNILGEKLDFLAAPSAVDVGGVESLVKIIRGAGRKSEMVILEELGESHPELSAQIKAKMFVFEDIVLLDNISIQKLLKNIDMKLLVLALKKASDDITNLVMNNLSERAKSMLQDEMQFLGKIPLKEVEAAQQEVAETIRRLEETGEITIRKEDEVYV